MIIKIRTHYKVLKEFFDIENIGRLAILNKKDKKYNILRIEKFDKKYSDDRDKLIKLIIRCNIILFFYVSISISFF